MGASPPCPYAAILIAAAPASVLLKVGKLGYHRGASGIKSAFPSLSMELEAIRYNTRRGWISRMAYGLGWPGRGGHRAEAVSRVKNMRF